VSRRKHYGRWCGGREYQDGRTGKIRQARRTGAHLIGRLPPLRNGERLDDGDAEDEEDEEDGIEGLQLL